MGENVIRISRLRIYSLLGICVIAWASTLLFLEKGDPYTAMKNGGLYGCIGVANYCFSAAVIGVAMMIFGMPTQLRIHESGFEESGPLGVYQCHWSEVERLQRVNSLGGSLVQVATKNGEHLFSGYYQISSIELLELMNRYRNANLYRPKKRNKAG